MIEQPLSSVVVVGTQERSKLDDGELAAEMESQYLLQLHCYSSLFRGSIVPH